MSFKKALLILLLLTNLKATEYTQEMGTRVYGIAQSLALSEEKLLYSCHYLNYDNRYYYSPPSYSSSYYSYSECSSFINIHKNSIRIDEVNGKPFFYAGWIHRGNLYEYIQYKNFHNKWFGYIADYPQMAQIIGTIDTKFKDIFARLSKAQQHREQLEDNFKEYQSEGINYDKYIEQVDSDMRLLSSHGMNLANVTKRLFATIKPKIIEARMRLDTISGRKETMGGLRSFENELSKVNNMPKDAIDASTAQMVDAINSAIDELERAVAK